MMNKEKKKLGLYLHIPFCEKKCYYCDFLSAPQDKKQQQVYKNALQEEIKSYKDLEKEYTISTLFLGGGTPSLWEGEEIASVIETIRQTFSLDKKIEKTIEANPGTLNREKLKIYKQIGINRLSIGLQSADNTELKRLGRIHTYEKFLENYNTAREVGFQNINIDLIYGLPGQTPKIWEGTLEKVIALKPEHISIYQLMIEEGTNFYKKYKLTKNFTEEEKLPTEETEEILEQLTKSYLKENQYFQYEISNYAKKGYECQHNMIYWKREEYLGLGLGASSLIQNIRFQNTDILNDYIENSYDSNKIKAETIILTKKQQMEEFMFLGLRMCKGISKEDFKSYFGIHIKDIYKVIIEKLIKQNLLIETKDRIYLTEKGLQISNYVMCQFLF